MLKSSLLEILRTFSKQELVKFEDFVRSPYFNKKENVVKLFLVIKRYAPALTDEELEKEKVWKTLFPVEKYNYGIMKNLIFDLGKLAEKFIMTLNSDKDEYQQTEYFLQSLFGRGLHKIYITKHNAIVKNLDIGNTNQTGLGMLDYLNFAGNIHGIKFDYHTQYDPNFKTDNLYSTFVNFLITKFLCQFFMIYNGAVSLNININFDLKNDPLSKLLEILSPGLKTIVALLKESNALNSVLVSILHAMYLCLSEKTENRYLEFKSVFLTNISLIPRANLRTFYYYLINGALLTNMNKLEYRKETLEIMDSQISNDAILQDNRKMNIMIFDKYISLCFSLCDSKKLKAFSDKFTVKLESDQIENTKKYVNFMLCFINKDYSNALNFLSLMDVSTANKGHIRYQKAMCLYETDNYEMFLNEFDNMRHFIKTNNSINQKFKILLTNHFSWTKKLFNIRQSFQKYEYLDLKKTISANKFALPWFHEKLDEIGKANLKQLDS